MSVLCISAADRHGSRCSRRARHGYRPDDHAIPQYRRGLAVEIGRRTAARSRDHALGVILGTTLKGLARLIIKRRVLFLRCLEHLTDSLGDRGRRVASAAGEHTIGIASRLYILSLVRVQDLDGEAYRRIAL